MIQRSEHLGFAREAGQAVGVFREHLGENFDGHGGSIVFFRADAAAKERFQIVRRTIASGTEQTLLRTAATVFAVRPSPDGKVVAALTRENGDYGVLLIPTGGGDPREFVRVRRPDSLGPRDQAWTPDGRYLPVTRTHLPEDRRQLWAYPTAGGSPHRIDIDNLLLPEVHPDGRQIAYTVPVLDGEVRAIENLAAAPGRTK
jgi:Tol biopolymer transport system component